MFPVKVLEGRKQMGRNKAVSEQNVLSVMLAQGA